MHSSYIATIAPEALTEEAGYVLLGIIDNRAYVHFAESSRPSFADEADVLYDPDPQPFAWENFAAAYPALAASPGEDEDGNPLPSVLTPHQWAGE